MTPTSSNQSPWLRRIAVLLPLAVGIWLWWQAATVATAYLLGENERFQQLVITIISDLRASGSFTLLMLGTIYAAFSLVQLAFWPRTTLQRRLGASALIFWAVVSAVELLLQVAGMAPYEQALIVPLTSAAPILLLFRWTAAVVTTLGPELLIGWALLQWFPALAGRATQPQP